MNQMPSVHELMEFYKANKAYVDLIVENAVRNNPQLKVLKQRSEYEKQFKEFAAEFPESGLNTPEDFMRSENAEQFLSLIRKGLSITQAYKLCNFAALLENAGNKGKKAGMEQVRSKAHLKSTGSNMGTASDSIPEDVKEFYHALMGDWSDSQIAKHYSKR